MKSRDAGDPSLEAPSLVPGQVTRLLQEIMAVPDDPLAPAPGVGDRIGRFLLVREIGRGGFGLVFEAEDTHLQRRVAIKVLRPERGRSSKTLEWIQREGEAAARVHHPTVVTLHDVGQWEGGTYLVYELLEGETLKARLERGPLSRTEARHVLRSVATGLAQMHAAGVIHRDLKPANVFITADGAIKILDLGLAQVAGAVGIVAGSPPYVAPEQWEGRATDERADVYAWGMLAQRLMTGKASGASTGPVESRPLTFRALTGQARAQEPALRPADGIALVAELDRLDWRKRRATLLGAACVGVALVGLVYALGRMLGPHAPVPSGPFRVAVADAENGSGKPTLDGLGDLVAREFQASPRLPGARPDPARWRASRLRPGRPGTARPGHRWLRHAPGRGRRAARARRRRRRGRALHRHRRARAGERAAPLLRRRSGPLRGRRRPRGGAPRRPGPGRSSATGSRRSAAPTRRSPGPSPRASRPTSTTSRACAAWIAPSGAGGSSFENCDTHFLQALAIDPEFPLAHFELARIRWWADYPADELRTSLEIPLRHLDRLSARERSMVLAWDASLSPTRGRAVEILQASARDFPEDARIALCARRGAVPAGPPAPRQSHPSNAPSSSIPASSWPTTPWSGPSESSIEGRTSSASRTGWRGRRPRRGRLISEAKARGFTGDAEGALEVLRHAAPGGTGLARDDLEDALVAAGLWAEAEAMLQEDALRNPGRADSRLVRYLLLRGRVREATSVLARLPPLRTGASASTRTRAA